MLGVRSIEIIVQHAFHKQTFTVILHNYFCIARLLRKLLENMLKLYYNFSYKNILTLDERIDRKEIICSYE